MKTSPTRPVMRKATSGSLHVRGRRTGSRFTKGRAGVGALRSSGVAIRVDVAGMGTPAYWSPNAQIVRRPRLQERTARTLGPSKPGGGRPRKTPRASRGDGRYKTRTCDLHDVNVAL